MTLRFATEADFQAFLGNRAPRIYGSAPMAPTKTSIGCITADGALLLTLPLRLPSLLNSRMHPLALHRLLKRQLNQVQKALLPFRLRLPSLPATATLTRIGPKPLDPDNLAASFKAVQDGIAQFFGVDDGSDAWTWVYAQEKGAYGLKVEIRSRSQR